MTKVQAAEGAKKVLSIEDIEKAQDREVLPVEVPEWKGTVYLRVLPADEGIAMSESMQALPQEKRTDAVYILLGACMGRPDGAALFESTDHARKTLSKKNVAVLLRLQDAAMKLNGITPGDAPAKNA